MIRLSELMAIEQAFFRADTIYHKPSLYPFLASSFSENRLFDESSLSAINKMMDSCKGHAHDLILKQDLKSIRDNIVVTFDEEAWLRRNAFLQVEKHLGLKSTGSRIVFCNKFEGYEHYEKLGASVITVFDKNTILFMSKRVDPVSTPIHIIHEHVHSCLSGHRKDYVEWIEEALAIFFSLMIHYEIAVDIQVLHAYRTRSYVYSQCKPQWDFTKRYFEYMKIISGILLHIGTDGIAMLKNDYVAGKDCSGYLDMHRIQYQPKNEFEDYIAGFPMIIEPELVTPLEYLILSRINEPKNIEQVAAEVQAPLELVGSTATRLMYKGLAFVKDGAVQLNLRKKDLFLKGFVKPAFPRC